MYEILHATPIVMLRKKSTIHDFSRAIPGVDGPHSPKVGSFTFPTPGGDIVEGVPMIPTPLTHGYMVSNLKR